MKKKFLITAFAVGSTLCISQNSYGYTVLGSASLTPLGSHSYNLGCSGNNGICYTNIAGVVDIYMSDGTHVICSFPVAPPVLVPVAGQNETYRQVGTVEVEEL